MSLPPFEAEPGSPELASDHTRGRTADSVRLARRTGAKCRPSRLAARGMQSRSPIASKPASDLRKTEFGVGRTLDFSKQDPRPQADSRGRGYPWVQHGHALEAEPGFAVLASQRLEQSGLEGAHQLTKLVLMPVAMRVCALPVPAVVALISRERRDKEARALVPATSCFGMTRVLRSVRGERSGCARSGHGGLRQLSARLSAGDGFLVAARALGLRLARQVAGLVPARRQHAHVQRAVLRVDAAATTRVPGYDVRTRIARIAVVHGHGV
jgi:hypothetical protein